MGTTIAAGLEGVIAGESEICYIDGYQGILSYRGYNIHTLADNASFEEVIFLLWNGWLPKQGELDQLKKDLVAERGTARAGGRLSEGVPKGNPMDVLRTAVSMLGLYDPEAQDMSAEANHRKAIAADVAGPPPSSPRFDRLRKGNAVSRRRPGAGFLGEFPLHPHRQAAGRRHGARLRRRHDPACRSRIERLHLRGARDGRDAVRYLLLHHVRHRRAQGAAARRRQPGRDQVAARTWATKRTPWTA